MPELPDATAELDPADLAETARQLRALVETLPPTTARDRATARRIEGAAVVLGAVAERPGIDGPTSSGLR